MNLFICMFVCMYSCACVCACCMHACVCVSVCVCVPACVCVLFVYVGEWGWGVEGKQVGSMDERVTSQRLL